MKQGLEWTERVGSVKMLLVLTEGSYFGDVTFHLQGLVVISGFAGVSRIFRLGQRHPLRAARAARAKQGTSYCKCGNQKLVCRS